MSEADTVTVRIATDVLEAVNTQRKERNQPLTPIINAAAKLWISLPVTVQALLLAGQTEGDELQQMINHLIDEKLKRRK